MNKIFIIMILTFQNLHIKNLEIGKEVEREDNDKETNEYRRKTSHD